MRQVVATFVAAAMLAACSDGKQAGSPPTVAPASPDTLDDSDPQSNDTSDPSGPLPSGAARYDEVAAAAGRESPEAVVALWAALSGPLPSAPDPVEPDVHPSFTEAIEAFEAVRTQLDPADEVAIADRVEELLDADFSFQLDEDSNTVDEPAPVPSDAEGFRSGTPRSVGDEFDDDDFRDDARTAWMNAADSARSQLQARLPGAADMNVQVVVTSPSFWQKVPPAPGETEPSEPGGGTLVRAGLEPDSQLHVLVERYGEADCYLLVARDARRPTSSAEAVGMLAHELFHCWHYVSVGRDADLYRAGPFWFREGIAGWVGETIAGGSSYTDRWLSAFVVDDFPLFANDYEAYGFWGRIDETIDLWTLIPSLVDTANAGGDAGVYHEAMGAIGDAAAYVSAGAVQHETLGPLWRTGEWMPARFRRPLDAAAVSADSPYESRVGAGVQTAAELTTDAPEGAIVTINLDGYGVVELVDSAAGAEVTSVGTATSRRLCVIECVCPATGTPVSADATVDVADPSFLVALAGGGSGPTTLDVTVRTGDDTDCPEPEEFSSAGLIGTWRANPSAVAAAFEQTSVFGDDESPINVEGASGDVLMTFAEDGTGTLTWADVTLIMSEELIGAVTLNGNGTFNWGGTAPNIEISGTSFAISVRAAAVGDNLLTITDADVSAGGVTDLGAIRAGDMLTVFAAGGSEGAVFFPVSWVRQPDADE